MENTDVQSISQTIKDTINSIFSDLFYSIDNNLYSILDDITFINSDIFSDKYFQNIFGTSSTNGILLIANALLIGFILYYAITLLISYYSYSEVQKPGQYLFRVIFFVILMNSSYFICEQIINFNFNISSAIRQIGESIFRKGNLF